MDLRKMPERRVDNRRTEDAALHYAREGLLQAALAAAVELREDVPLVTRLERELLDAADTYIAAETSAAAPA